MSSIMTPHVTGVFSVIAFVFCLSMNAIHFYLSKTSKPRSTIFGRRLIGWSHGSMLLVAMAPLFMIFSYIHPEFFFSGDTCLCGIWYKLAVVFFVTGLFFLKINYLVRLNMVLHPGRTKQLTPFFKTYFSVLVTECVTINIIQLNVIEGDCDVTGFYGCNATFASWNGWMACGILIHDMILYYLFCVYFIRRARSKLLSEKQMKLKMSRVATDDISEPTSMVSMGANTAGLGSKSLHTQSRTAGTASASVVATPESGMNPVAAPNINIIRINSNSLDLAAQAARKQRLSAREREKMAIVYNGLVRQFRITLFAIAACAVDMFVNTVWMDYNMLWMFMVDCCAVVTFNFLAFRDSQRLVKNWFDKAVSFGCDGCSLLIDICCCMGDTAINASRRDDPSVTITGSDEDSFLRYENGNDGNETSGDDDGSRSCV